MSEQQANIAFLFVHGQLRFFWPLVLFPEETHYQCRKSSIRRRHLTPFSHQTVQIGFCRRSHAGSRSVWPSR